MTSGPEQLGLFTLQNLLRERGARIDSILRSAMAQVALEKEPSSSSHYLVFHDEPSVKDLKNIFGSYIHDPVFDAFPVKPLTGSDWDEITYTQKVYYLKYSHPLLTAYISEAFLRLAEAGVCVPRLTASEAPAQGEPSSTVSDAERIRAVLREGGTQQELF